LSAHEFGAQMSPPAIAQIHLCEKRFQTSLASILGPQTHYSMTQSAGRSALTRTPGARRSSAPSPAFPAFPSRSQHFRHPYGEGSLGSDFRIANQVLDSHAHRLSQSEYSRSTRRVCLNLGLQMRPAPQTYHNHDHYRSSSCFKNWSCRYR
jgi:hypothetical protein